MLRALRLSRLRLGGARSEQQRGQGGTGTTAAVAGAEQRTVCGIACGVHRWTP
jgi:hypothetical protein